MRLLVMMAAIVAFSVAPLAAQQKDDFKRGGDEESREIRAPLEGRAPPPLEVTGWLNTDDKAIKLGDLKGKVVLIDFWGTW